MIFSSETAARSASSTPDPSAAYRLTEAFVAELARQGVRHACICPGSRSTPLAITFARQPDVRLWMHLDERSAAFFALGLAKGSGQPVALVCTSGTAAANFFPAVVEAHAGHVPLIVCTADRPPELQQVGANQTIQQLQLYGEHVRLFVQMPVPDGHPDVPRYARVAAQRAVAAARAAPQGPAHVNFPFREPLVPVEVLGGSGRAAELGVSAQRAPSPSLSPTGGGEEPLRTSGTLQVTCSPILPPLPALGSPPELGANARRTPGSQSEGLLPEYANTDPSDGPSPAIASLARSLRSTQRGLIVCGPQDDQTLPDALLPVAAQLGLPVLADPLSGLRRGPRHGATVLDSYDAFLRDPAVAGLAEPEVILRFGAAPTSKALLQWLERCAASTQILFGGGEWTDPALVATESLSGPPAVWCRQIARELAGHEPSGDTARWCEQWQMADAVARAVLRDGLRRIPVPFEGRVFDELAELLPDGAVCFAGNSMPVRDLDTFFPGGERPLRFVANRGASGIDGVVSTALGVAASGGGPVVLVLGDLSFYHDMNGLLAARQYGLALTIVLINNDGGGIFSFLPQSEVSQHFEQLFGTPHGLDFAPAAALYGATYCRPASWEEFRAAVAEGLSGGLHIVEVRTDRSENVRLHRDLWRDVAAALRDPSLPSPFGRGRADERAAGSTDENWHVPHAIRPSPPSPYRGEGGDPHRAAVACTAPSPAPPPRHGEGREGLSVPLHVTVQGDGPPLVLLHGFTGSAGTWQYCAPALAGQFTLVMPDLIGHGASPAPGELDRYRMPQAVADVVALLDALELGKVDLLGYSMGGRLALHVAAAHPERVAALVLESASPGLAEEAERTARRQGDESLASRLERDGVAAFVAEWERQPLFASQQRLPASVRERQRAERLANAAIGLANSLRGMGTGAQAPLWDRLTTLNVPTLLLTGAEDTKYGALAAAMAERLPAARAVVVPDAGHTVHLEQPGAFARHVRDFLKQWGRYAQPTAGRKG